MIFQQALARLSTGLVTKGSRVDGWVNALLGFGTNRDPREVGHFQPCIPIPWPELEAMFHENDMARKVVVLPPREMLRQGFEIVTKDAQQKENLKQKCVRLDLTKTYFLAMVWARLFGGSVIFIGADDGRPACEPLIPSQVRSVNFLQIYDRRYAYVVSRYTDPKHPKFRQPSVYQLVSIWGDVSEVHESRLEIFRGALTDDKTREMLNTWDYSILQAPYVTLRQFDMTYSAAELMMKDASQGVFKMKGLMSMIAGKRTEDIATRAQLLDMTRSVARSVFLDADGSESFEKIATQFASVDSMLDKFANRLAAAVEIPVTLLMGQAPAGLNATGDNDMRIFYDTIKAEQSTDLLPRIRHVLRLIAWAQQSDPMGVDVKFPPLWQETPKEKAERRKLIAEADQIYLTNDVVTPEEMAKNRFGGSDYSDETKIDMSLRLGSFLPAKAPPGPPGAGAPPRPPGQ